MRHETVLPDGRLELPAWWVEATCSFSTELIGHKLWWTVRESNPVLPGKNRMLRRQSFQSKQRYDPAFKLVAAARIESASEGYEPSLGPIQIRRIDKLFGGSEGTRTPVIR